MEIDRRQFLATSGLATSYVTVAGCASIGPAPTPGHERGARAADPRLDVLLAAHADRAPESAGGANHYPMAAEALEALGRADAIPSEWTAGGSRYPAAPEAREAPAPDERPALGDRSSYAAWLALLSRELARDPWRAVLQRWVPVLAPGVAGAAWHGLVRAAHAARALRRAETAERRGELAIGLAYWAAEFAALPQSTARDERPATPFAERMRRVAHPWLHDDTDVDFFGVTPRLVAAPPLPADVVDLGHRSADEALGEVVRATATAFQEMLVQERHRIWMLHAVTGPAAAMLLTPDLGAAAARELARHSARAALATHAAFGAPYEARAHVRAHPGPWPALITEATSRGSVHTAKLVEALVRCDTDGDPLWRSVGETWLAWR